MPETGSRPPRQTGNKRPFRGLLCADLGQSVNLVDGRPPAKVTASSLVYDNASFIVDPLPVW